MPSRNRLAGRVHAVSGASQDRRSALDWLRNGLGATAVSCARAGVSFTVTTIRTRLEADENRPVAWFTDLAQKLPEFKAPRPPGRRLPSPIRRANHRSSTLLGRNGGSEPDSASPRRSARLQPLARPLPWFLVPTFRPSARPRPSIAPSTPSATARLRLHRGREPRRSPGPRQLAAAYLLIAGMKRIGHCGRCAHPSLLEEDKETDLKRGARPDRHDPAANAYG